MVGTRLTHLFGIAADTATTQAGVTSLIAFWMGGGVAEVAAPADDGRTGGMLAAKHVRRMIKRGRSRRYG